MQQATFCNPVPFADGKPHTNPDPFVLRWCGAYYCYATDENGVLVSSSADLVHWTAHGYALRQPEHRNFWAPAVLYHNGVFSLYYSHEPREILQLATSRDPLGPFVWQAQLSELFSIDAHPVVWQGERYLFYASDEWMGCEEERPGTSILLDRLLPDGRPEGRPVPVLLPDSDSEIFARSRFGDGRHWHTLEGPCFLPGEKHSFLLYSANCYTSENYYVHYAVAENQKDLRDMVWHKQGSLRALFPLLRRSRTVEGTGHNTVATAPDLVHWWMVYHGRPVGEPVFPGEEQRQMYLAPLQRNGQTLWTPMPTHEPQAVPQQPGYYCAEQRLAPQQRWDICDLPQTVRMETWFHPQSRHTGVKFSLYLAAQDEQNVLELACLPDWLAVSPAELTDAGLAGEKGTLEIRPAALPGTEERFTLSGEGGCTLQADGGDVCRCGWEREGATLRREARQERCDWYVEERLVWSGRADTLQIHGAILHRYEFVELH